MVATTLKTPYSTAMPYVSAALVTWLDELEAQRIASYDLYDDLYHNDPATAKMLLRGTDEKPIYIPTAKKIVKTVSRYVGRGWAPVVSAPTVDALGQPITIAPEQLELARQTINNLFLRERLQAQFTSGKKAWLRRGDWVWYIQANTEKAPGSRISITWIDPRIYFPIADPADPDRDSGASLIEETLVGDKAAVKVQRWLKPNHPEHPNFGAVESPDTPFSVAYDSITYDMDGYADPTKRKTLATGSPLILLEGISAVPLYLIRNDEESDEVYGRSELSGLESIMAGINQATSDEDLSLALSGLGMYWTDSGAPVDDNNVATTWKLGPNRVVEVDDGTTFNRVKGVDSIEPFQDHIKYLFQQANGINGVNDVATGETDSSTAISGLALSIKMQPLLDAALERNDSINGIFNQLFHDLKEWLLVYEEIDLGEVVITSTTSESGGLPFDRDAAFTELMTLKAANLVGPTYVYRELNDKFGYDIGPDDIAEAETAATTAAAAADAVAARQVDELSAEDDTTDESGTDDGDS